ncbi:hypothetical protein AB9F29_00290 [Falsihalocynthiibacter sp. S25ZX9]|uniref:hypothetical protein n=1 Tax=Falsihalocynthiibacter sp. S25ZX9 TaxID=3240870 RepID=UPI00350F3C8B
MSTKQSVHPGMSQEKLVRVRKKTAKRGKNVRNATVGTAYPIIQAMAEEHPTAMEFVAAMAISALAGEPHQCAGCGGDFRIGDLRPAALCVVSTVKLPNFRDAIQTILLAYCDECLIVIGYGELSRRLTTDLGLENLLIGEEST